MKKIAIIIAVVFAALTLSSCTSDADKASENLSKAAEQFEVQRRIVGVNAITGEYAFEVEGRCSIEVPDRRLEVVCRHAENDYRKHFVGLADNVYYVVVQLDGIDVSVYHTRIVIKPQNVIPEFDLEAGKQ